jgi:hypothetical protein
MQRDNIHLFAHNMKLNISNNGNKIISNIISVAMHSLTGTSHQMRLHKVCRLATNALNQIVNYWMKMVQLGEKC